MIWLHVLAFSKQCQRERVRDHTVHTARCRHSGGPEPAIAASPPRVAAVMPWSRVCCPAKIKPGKPVGPACGTQGAQCPTPAAGPPVATSNTLCLCSPCCELRAWTRCPQGSQPPVTRSICYSRGSSFWEKFHPSNCINIDRSIYFFMFWSFVEEQKKKINHIFLE